jgi:hypothetical protein
MYKEDISRDFEGVPLKSLCISFVFRVGIKDIVEEDVLVTEDLHCGMGSGGSQPS